MLLKQEEKKLDPRVRRTRQLLQQALMALMAEKSFQAITVQDIAERATVNRVTFYAHFADKYALLEYAIREMIQQRLRSQVPEGTLFSSENLARLILTVCEFLAEINRRCPPPHGQLGPLMEKQIKVELYEILRTWLAEMPAGESSRPATPELGAMVTSWAIYGAAVQWSQQDRPVPAGEFVQQVLPLILASLQPSAKLPAPS
ncbi:MAG: TetR/AcrR family transcriptional regulator [Chloroflexi bacterium]|nr:TetR/AcrR family transcriptional regulator [Chloroflexota bacterium]MCI0577370.1 TetR/AcrR family transcriptional regulator [Chloroflexota bacterium]MCI0647057.1 TetR/AcrR family transcriptional regulator [Chloroflexota bacterium]MCI0731544.1 TetR/AcrR family transcriptional regulator [Chloroflexota bacterium]